MGGIDGAESIANLDLLRDGGISRLFCGGAGAVDADQVLAGVHLGQGGQRDVVTSRLLINLAGHAPLLPGADELAYIDIDDTVRRPYGYAKQSAGRGYTVTKGPNAVLVIVAGEVIAAARLHKRCTNDVIDCTAIGTASARGPDDLHT